MNRTKAAIKLKPISCAKLLLSSFILVICHDTRSLTSDRKITKNFGQKPTITI
ncbi:MAG: hypothetical protein ACTSVI_04595 [Promethearchaeota archaeon]